MAEISPAVEVLNDGMMDGTDAKDDELLETAVPLNTFLPLAGIALTLSSIHTVMREKLLSSLKDTVSHI